MTEESLIYKYTLLKKREWFMFAILVFSILCTKLTEIYTIKFLYTSTSLGKISVNFIKSSGYLPFLSFVGLIVVLFINIYYFSQNISHKKQQIKFNLITFLIILFLGILSILIYDPIDFKVFVYLLFVLFFSLTFQFFLAYLYFKSLNNHEIESLQNEKLRSWFIAESFNILITVICSFVGFAILEVSMNDIQVWSETEKLLSDSDHINLFSDQYDLYIIVIFICYYRLLFNRINPFRLHILHFLFIILFASLIVNVNFTTIQLSLIQEYDYHFFPKKTFITFQKRFFFNLDDYLHYLDELGSIFWYQLAFVAILVFKDKFDFISKQRNIEIIRQKEIENLLLKTQLSQINPHFIYNTLNFISTKAKKSSLELQSAIDTFSEIIQYSLEGSLKGDINDNVLQTSDLSDEIRHLKNYIEIHRKRYDGNIFVNLDIDGSTDKKVILPLILINYVENAFKYGIFQDDKNPIIIRIKIQSGIMVFNIKNKKNKHRIITKSTGIGNERTLMRIQFAYPERYNFDILDEPDFYTVSLTINL